MRKDASLPSLMSIIQLGVPKVLCHPFPVESLCIITSNQICKRYLESTTVRCPSVPDRRPLNNTRRSGRNIREMSLSLTATLRGHKGAVWGLSFSAAGLLASCGVDQTVRVWALSSDSKTWTCVAVAVDTFRRTVRSLAWGSDGRSLAAACFDGIATVLRVNRGTKPALEPAVSLAGHESEVKGVAFSSSGGLLATCSRDRSVWIWEVGADFDYECIAVLNGHSADVKAVTWHPMVEMLVSCGYDAVAKIWVEDEDDWFCAETLAAHDFHSLGCGLSILAGSFSYMFRGQLCHFVEKGECARQRGWGAADFQGCCEMSRCARRSYLFLWI